MMKNKKTYTTSASDELRSLLDILEEDRSGNAAAVDSADEPERMPCLYKGKVYSVPIPDFDFNLVKAFGASLSFGIRSVHWEDGPMYFFLPDGAEACPELVLSLDVIVKAEHLLSDYAFRFFLYREGTPEPVALALGLPDEKEDKVHFYFPAIDGGFLPGRYFLVGCNFAATLGESHCEGLNKHLCLPFRFLAAGASLPHPAVQSAVFSRPDAEWKEGGYTSGLMEVAVHTDCRLSADSEFGLWCYSQEWNLMAQTNRFVSRERREDGCVTFRLQAWNIWMPGRYFAVLAHNREPYALLAFHYEGRQTGTCECRSLSTTDKEYRLVKHLEADAACGWKALNGIHGLSAIKPRLAERGCTGGFNSYCTEKGWYGLRSNSFVAVLSPDADRAERLAGSLPGLLDFGTDTYSRTDCADWVASPNKAMEALKERSSSACCLYNLPALCDAAAGSLLDALVEAVCDTSVFWALILCGTEEELARLWNRAPALMPFFTEENRFSILPVSAAELADLAQTCVAHAGFRLSPAAEHALALQVMECYGRIRFWGQKEFRRFFNAAVFPQLRQRARTAYARAAGAPDRRTLVTLSAADIDLTAYATEWEARKSAAAREDFECGMRELNALVGLKALKEELSATFLRTRFEEERRRLGLPAGMDGTHHMIFTGNPGTGKSTVARLIGRVYHSLGLLSKGDVIVTERNRLVGKYIGQTEENMLGMLSKAKGNVLFIDEAYTLCDTMEDRKDFGNRAIESLLTVLADPHPDMIVILAGYAEEMERLMQMNQGLEGRFPHRFHFDDFTADELMQIARDLLARDGYILSPEAEALLTEVVGRESARKERSFDNARWVNRLVLSGMLPAMARRVMQHGLPLTAELCRQVERADVEQAAGKFCKPLVLEPVLRRKIGFRA